MISEPTVVAQPGYSLVGTGLLRVPHDACSMLEPSGGQVFLKVTHAAPCPVLEPASIYSQLCLHLEASEFVTPL